MQHDLVDLIAAGVGLVVLAERKDAAEDDHDDQPPEVADEIRQVDDNLGEERELAAEALEESGEDRNHFPQNDVDDDNAIVITDTG